MTRGRRRRGRRHRRGRARRPDPGEHPWTARRSDAGGRRARQPHRLSARRRPRRRGAAHLPVDRSGRRACCRTPCPTRSCGSSTPSGGCSPRWRRRTPDSAGPSATASSSRWSTPNCSAASTDSTTSRCGGAIGWQSCTETADGVTVEFADGHEPGAGPLRRRLRRRPQRHPPADGRVVRRHHLLDAVAGRRLSPTIHWDIPTARSGRIRRGRTCRSRSRTASGASSS